MPKLPSYGRFDVPGALTELLSEWAGPGQPMRLYAHFERICRESVGHRLFTLLAWSPETDDVQRIHSSRPAEYPTSARKAMGPTEWGSHVLKGGQSWFGRHADDIRWAFPDRDLILSLGCESCLNTPVIFNGQVLGAVSVLGPAGAYTEADLAGLERITPALVPAFLLARA